MDRIKIVDPKKLRVSGKEYLYYDINELEKLGLGNVKQLPFSIKVLLEGALRNYDNHSVTKEHILHLSKWTEGYGEGKEIPFNPARIILQDFTGVPAVVDLAAMRSAIGRAGGDSDKINPLIPVDLVIDHSVMVDAYGSDQAMAINTELEFTRNKERYQFLKWAQNSFENFRVVPPSTGIIHQVNLEYLASSVVTKETEEGTVIYPDSLVGTDSHTTMINGLGVLGWGVGGLEAEAGMLGQPLYFITPEVIGFEFVGELSEGATATDLALTVTEILRNEKVVGKFVEYFGEGVKKMAIADRATVANMSPEYGATMGYFPVDEQTLKYLELTGRDPELIQLARAYYTATGMLSENEQSEVIYSKKIKLDLGTVKPSLAGPKRPQDKINLDDMQKAFSEVLVKAVDERGFGLEESEIDKSVEITWEDGTTESLKTGSVTIASITSCTNTSNPSVMLGAGLVAQKAVALGLKPKKYVKTSLTPGSKVVTEYLKSSGVLKDLESIGFNVTGYGCGTCIGNSGPLPEPVAKAIEENDMTVASVLSGNRNFEGRVHSMVKANYLASPMLVVVFALAGTVDIDLNTEPISVNDKGEAVYFKDIWPTSTEIQALVSKAFTPDLFRSQYSDLYNEKWSDIESDNVPLYQWNEESSYIQEPPFFVNMKKDIKDVEPIEDSYVLAMFGDSITTDHISPAGTIAKDSPAGQYLSNKGIDGKDFNSYGSRRGNHEVMMRGTLANIRIRNHLAKGVEGGYTTCFTTGEIMPIYDAAMKYQAENKPSIILAGKEYGTGSSRDWAAKGVNLLGVKAVIAESYERIHRSNLVGIGVLPLQFLEGESWASLSLTGEEKFDIKGLTNDIKPFDLVEVIARGKEEKVITFKAIVRIDSTVELEYYRNGGILHKVLRDMI